MKPIHYIIGTAVAILGFLGLGALAFMYSGIYDIAASTPHLAPFRWAVTTLQTRAVEESAKGIRVPPLQDPALIRRGVELYDNQCVVCHGAPGVERPVVGRGMNPNPPRLAVSAVEWRDAELYWIIKNGIKMGGMPAFWSVNTDADIWSLVAFVRRLPELTEKDYVRMLAALRGEVDPASVSWIAPDDGGWTEMRHAGDPRRGARLLERFGCGSCHVIPGLRTARGNSGPPLTRWAERHFIAGNLLNQPRNLVDWIVEPGLFEPGTAMPDVGATREEALHMAAYLFSLGESPRARRVARQPPD